MMGWSIKELLASFMILVISYSNAAVVQLTPANINDVLAGNEVVFVNFYADWCRFSQMLGPVFEDASNKVAEEIKDPGKVVFAKVDCDKETSIAQQYHVSKYPTLKLFRHGQLVKREYRGQRSAEALGNYVKDMLKSTIIDVKDPDELDNLDRKKRHIVGYFEHTDGADYKAFMKVASLLRDDCSFYSALGSISERDRIAGNKVIYRPPGEHNSDMIYSGQIQDHTLLHQWTTDKCVPLVREITFENAEELTEEGLPFMILFHSPEDTETPEQFRKTVAKDLLGEKKGISFITADGHVFKHPLMHLGKSTNDLPLIAIDSFRHMYLWNKDVKTNLNKGHLLKQFIADLHSGKLHREFHHGPDPVTKQVGSDSNAQPPADNNLVDVNVQQQIIMHGDGVKIQVVRLVQVGQPNKQIDIAGQLQAIAEATGEMLDEARGKGADATQEEDNFQRAIEDLKNGDEEDQKNTEIDQESANKDESLAIADVSKAKESEQAVNKENENEVQKEGDEKLAEAVSVGGQGKDDENPDDSDTAGTKPKTQKAWNKVQEDRKQQALKDATTNKVDSKTTVIEKVDNIKVAAYDYEDNEEEDVRQPPKSIFSRLLPSSDRYTILKRDEL